MADFFTHPVVCNTGPLIALSRAKVGHLLLCLFPRVITTQTVVSELLAKDAGDAAEIHSILKSLEVWDSSPPDPLLTTELDAGEASVIQAARDLGLSGVLIDERRARRIATTVYDLEVRGICAILVRAKHQGLISSVKPLLETMLMNGYFIGPLLAAETLRQAGE